METPFILGVNYFPRRKAMYWWSNFDAGEVREEFALIRELGMNIVRIFLLWEDFQPSPDTVSTTALNHLIEVCDIASDTGLKLDVTFFTGHMSGPNWSPDWLLNDKDTMMPRPVVTKGVASWRGYRNPFTDPIALAAEKLQLQTVIGALHDHPAIWMWNLGNEPDLFAHPPNAAAGSAWVQQMTDVIRACDPVHPITFGLHSDSLLFNNGLRVDQVYAHTDVAVMHAYPMYHEWAKSPTDTDFVPFTCALTAALSGKPVLMEEFGGATALPGQDSYTMEWMLYGKPRTQFMLSETALADYFEAVLPNLVEVGATGAMLWCFADYAPELWTRPPCDEYRHERFFGLVRPDGSLKPHAQVIKKFAESHSMVLPIPDWARLDVQPDHFYADPTRHTVELYDRYLAQKQRNVKTQA